MAATDAFTNITHNTHSIATVKNNQIDSSSVSINVPLKTPVEKKMNLNHYGFNDIT